MLLSDLADGATKSRAHGSFRHDNAYYEERVMTGGRETEIFANVVSISGESEFAERMVEHFFPALYQEVMDLLKSIK